VTSFITVLYEINTSSLVILFIFCIYSFFILDKHVQLAIEFYKGLAP